MAQVNTGNGISIPVNQNVAFSKKTEEASVLEGLSSVGRSAVATVMEYVDKMDPKVIKNEEESIRRQVGLYKALTMTINRNDQDFNKTWSAILKIVNDNLNGVFHDSKVFQYMHNTTLSAEKRKTFQRLLYLLKATAPVQGRKLVLRQIDFKKVLAFDITGVGRQRVLNYYQPYMDA